MKHLSDVTLLDGGMGRQLSRMGAPFRLPEWSALALMEAPQFVAQAHAAFIAAGAQIITTNSYALVPSRIGAARFATDGLRLVDLAGRLACEAAGRAGSRVLVAGSLPPVFESYRPDLFDAGQAPAVIDLLVTGLAPHVDLWLIETQSSLLEAGVALQAVSRSKLPVWVSYTLRDELGRDGPPELRSGESVTAAVEFAVSRGAQSVLFNCSQPEVMNEAVLAAFRWVETHERTGVRIGVYANAFAPEPAAVEPYAGISPIRADLDPRRYLELAEEWVHSGARIVGGCCGIGPEHIAALRAHLSIADVA